MNNTKIELILEGLDCAGCSVKIEGKVKELKDVVEASLNFITKILAIEVSAASSVETVIKETKEIVLRLEPHVVVRNKQDSRVKETKSVKCKNSGCCDEHLEDEEHDDHPHYDNHQHDYQHEHNHSSLNNKAELIKLGLGGTLFLAAILLKPSGVLRFAWYFASYILVGGEVILSAVKNILKGEVFDENFLMSIATVGAFAIGEFPEGVAVMLFYQIGEFFQSIAVNRSRKSIGELMDIRPDYANLKLGDDIKRLKPEDVRIGQHILVKPGEKIPLDGTVIEGFSTVDTSALTGESVPREVEAGTNVLAGFINKGGLLTIEVEKEFGESTVSRILEMVQNASSKKAPTEKFITKFARYYTPVVVYTAVALAIVPPLLIKDALFSDWIYRALVFLVVSCPCALVVSIPLGFFGGIGGASRNGILIKGGNFLEALNNVDTVVFDKTGTLTKGIFKVKSIAPINIAEEELLEYAAFVESYSNHPIAVSILKAYGKDVNKAEVEGYQELLGLGVQAKILGKQVLAGNAKLMEKSGISFNEVKAIGTILYVAIDNNYAGHILISDEIKEDSKKSILELKKMGVKNIVMLTGDSKAVAQQVADELGITEVYGELLPDQKVDMVELLDKKKAPKKKLVFVGDGINDAPVLARADIGVAMGGLGSDAAIEAADVVLMKDEPSKLITAMKVAKKTNRIVWQNIIFAFGVKGIVLLLGAGGLATMWEAVFADVGVALIAVLNAMRVLNVKDI